MKSEDIKPTSYRELETHVIRWAEARKIIPRAKPQAQLNKALEELAELFKAESQGNLPGIKDGVGDVVVCLINYCALKDIDLVHCLGIAYSEIKDRKGTLMSDGTFVKEAA
jgi:NTP pyrophosphatase (non-canonical NTP hydrolase)